MNNEEIVKALLSELDRRIEFHQKNTNDPYGIDIAVICALSNVRDAVAKVVKDASTEGKEA